jgi:hypothetical protein
MTPTEKTRERCKKQSLDLLNFMQDHNMMYIFSHGDDRRPYFGETSVSNSENWLFNYWE